MSFITRIRKRELGDEAENFKFTNISPFTGILSPLKLVKFFTVLSEISSILKFSDFCKFLYKLNCIIETSDPLSRCPTTLYPFTWIGMKILEASPSDSRNSSLPTSLIFEESFTVQTLLHNFNPKVEEIAEKRFKSEAKRNKFSMLSDLL